MSLILGSVLFFIFYYWLDALLRVCDLSLTKQIVKALELVVTYDSGGEAGYHAMRSGRVAVLRDKSTQCGSGARLPCIWKRREEKIAWCIWKRKKDDLFIYLFFLLAIGFVPWFFTLQSCKGFAKMNNEWRCNAMQGKLDTRAGFRYTGFTTLIFLSNIV